MSFSLYCYAQKNKINVELLSASEQGCVEIVKELLEKGADPNFQDNEGYTALMKGLAKEEVVKLLLEKGADPNSKTNYGGTALIVASIGNRAEIDRR